MFVRQPIFLSVEYASQLRKLGLLIALAFGLLQGCATNSTSPRVFSDSVLGSEPTDQRRYFGFVSLAPTARESSNVDIVRVTGFGMRVAGGLSIGYFDDWAAHVKPGCQFVLMIPEGASAAEWQTNLQANLKESLCVISKP